MKTLLKEAVIWAVVGVLVFFLSVASANGGEKFPFNEEISGIRVWKAVKVNTLVGPVKIFCSIPGLKNRESVCVMAKREVFIEKGEGGRRLSVEKGKVLSIAPSVEAAVGLAAETINKILKIWQISEKAPSAPREFLRREPVQDRPRVLLPGEI